MAKEGFSMLVSLGEALDVIVGNAPGLGFELAKTSDCLGRVLAEDVVAGIDVPHFRKAAMDGFAVVAEDTFNASNTSPGELEIIDSISAGMVSRRKLTSGKCIEIATGAPVPAGANAVLMVEYTEVENGNLVVYKSVAPGENIIEVGSDIKKGTRMFSKGVVLNPRYCGVLVSLGIQSISVKIKPKVAVLSTGNEILKGGERLEMGKVYDINSRTLIDSLRERGCEVFDLGVVGDDREEIKKKILEGVGGSDFMILSGGSSLGRGDMITEIVSDLGELLIQGIAVKPGKPTIVGKIGGKLVIGLPGYPTSALSNFYILVIPLLERMFGACFERRVVEAELTRKVASTVGRYEFLPVRIMVKNGRRYAKPVLRGSSAITTLASADGFAGISGNTEVVNKGEVVEVILF